MIRSLYVKSQFIASTFDERYKPPAEWVIFEPSRPHHLDLKAQDFENHYLHLGVFLWNWYIILASYKYLYKRKFLLMYSFTHTNLVFLFRLRPTEIVVFISVCEKVKCFSGDNFSFLWSRFCWHSTYFFDFMWNPNKVFKDIKKEFELIFDQIKFIVFERVQLKKISLSYSATYFLHRYILHGKFR